MPTYSTCAFCGQNDSPRTREHVFADWIARESADPNWTRIDAATGKSVSFKGSLGLVSRKVCKRCNTGWMRKLESEAKPLLAPLIHATKRGPIPLCDQIIIARWFAKTIFAYDVVEQRRRECFFSSDDRLDLATKSFISTDNSIFIAQYLGTMGVALTIESEMQQLGASLDQQQTLLDCKGYAVTFIIKHLALQIFAFERSKNLIGKNLGFGLPAAWDRAALQLCLRGSTVNWPPEICLDDTSIKHFAARWSDLSLVLPK